jgi:hypothetical protein
VVRVKYTISCDVEGCPASSVQRHRLAEDTHRRTAVPLPELPAGWGLFERRGPAEAEGRALVGHVVKVICPAHLVKVEPA